jgi:hypothetical protein
LFLDVKASILANELYIRKRLKSLSLLCELSLDEQDRNYLADQLRCIIDQRGPSEATRNIREHYPALLASYLVLQGIYGYDRGDYWGDVCRRVNLPPDNYTAWWGLAFRGFLQEQNLPTFDWLHGFKNLIPILAHGGVPNSCLPEFFAVVLSPTARNAQLNGIDAEELLAMLRHRLADDSIVSKPVGRFLLHGGEVSYDFVNRCLEMARAAFQENHRLSAADLGLPERVVEAFHQWLDHQTTDSSDDKAPQHVPIRRPRLLLDVWAEGVCLELPPQDLYGANPQWRVQLADRLQALSCSDSHTIVVERPFESLQVALEQHGNELRRWEFRGLSSTSPVILFRAATGQLMQGGVAIADDAVSIITAPGSTLTWKSGRPLDRAADYAPLPLGWSRCGGCLLRLPPVADKLEWHLEGKSNVAIDLGERVIMQLVGATRCSSPYETNVEVPLFFDSAPILELRLDGNRESALLEHRLSIRALGPSSPSSIQVRTVRDLDYEISDDALRIPLSQPSLLGPAACGSWQITLRGQLGKDARTAFRVPPAFHLELLRETAEPRLRLRPVTSARLTSWQGSGWQAVASDSGVFDIDFVGMRKTLDLQMHIAATEREAVVPLTVSVDRWRWRLAGVVDRDQWCDEMIECSVEQMEGVDNACLLADVSPARTWRDRVSLEMLDSDMRCLASLEPAHGGSDSVRFDLRPFVETIRQLGVTARVTMVVTSAVQSVATWRREVLMLQRSWIVRDVRATARRDDAQWLIEVSWSGESVLPHRRLRLWSQWRPWEAPQSFPIPEADANRTTLALPVERVVPGAYWVELYVHDPWRRSIEQQPDAAADNVALVRIGTPHDMEAYLATLEPSAVTCVESYLASASTGPAQLSLLYPMRDVLREEDTPVLLELLLQLSEPHLRDRDETSTIYEFVSPFVLSQHGNRLLACICERAQRMRPEERPRLIRTCLQLGLLQSAELFEQRATVSKEVRERLWQLWPPLACFLCDPASPEDIDEAERMLGREAVARLIGHAQPLGIALKDAELKWPAAVIQAQLEWLKIMPAALLDDASFQTALANTLVALPPATAQRIECEKWLQQELSPLTAAVNLALEKGLLLSSLGAALRHCRPQHDPIVLALAWLPYAIGSIAALTCALAPSRGRRHISGLSGKQLRVLLLAAWERAPKLLTYDLCACQILLGQAETTSILEGTTV